MTRFRIVRLLTSALAACVVASSVSASDSPPRAIPVIVSVSTTNDYRVGQPLLVDIELFNGLETEIGFLSFGLTPNEWNREAFSVDVTDIYRDGQPPSIFFKHPETNPPRQISGVGSERVPAKGRKVIRIDLSKWQVAGGWKAGRYRFVVAVSNIDMDSFTTLRVRSEPAEITVK